LIIVHLFQRERFGSLTSIAKEMPADKKIGSCGKRTVFGHSL
jgi:hypothetical protein